MRLHLVPLALLLAAAALPSAAGDACVPACAVAGTTFAYAPAAVVVTDGATLRWTANDGLGHTSTADDWCFHTTYNSRAAGAATFRVGDDGTVYAKTATQDERACSGEQLGDGALAIPYTCIFHPLMVGRVIVQSG